MSESSNITVVVSRFERHVEMGSVSVHFYIRHPVLDVCTTIPSILPMEGSDSDMAQKGWELVFPQAVEWVRTTTAPVTGRQFVVTLPPPQNEEPLASLDSSLQKEETVTSSMQKEESVTSFQTENLSMNIEETHPSATNDSVGVVAQEH